MLELAEVARVLSGLAIRESPDGGSCFVRLSDVSEIKAGREPRLPKGSAPGVARALTIREGDLIVATRGAETDILLAPAALFGAYVSLDLYLVRPDRERVDPQYLRAFLALPATQSRLTAAKQGSSLARLPKDALEQTQISLPPMAEQRIIANLSRAFEEESRLLKKLSELNAVVARETLMRAIRAAETTKPKRRTTHNAPTAR